MKLVELSINNHIVDAIHKHHITHVMEHSTSAPNERVLRTTQLAKLSFNHPSVVLTADVFQNFYKKLARFFLRRLARSLDNSVTSLAPLFSCQAHPQPNAADHVTRERIHSEVDNTIKKSPRLIPNL